MPFAKTRARIATTAGVALLVAGIAAWGVGASAMPQTATTDDAATAVITEAPFDNLANKAPFKSTYETGCARPCEQDVAEAFPYQYWTFATEKYRDGKPFGHSTTQGKVEGAWLKDWGGQPILSENGYYQVEGLKWDKATGVWTLEPAAKISSLYMVSSTSCPPAFASGL